MPLELPKGFTAIKDATQPTDSINLIGVLVSHEPPKPTGGTSLALDFTIQDDFTSGDVGGQSSMRCRLFRRNKSNFPLISGVGDVIILRGFKLKEFRLWIEAVGSDMFQVNMLVFPSNRIPVPGMSQPFQAGSQKLPHASTGGPPPTIPEQMAVIHMKAASTGVAKQVQQHAATNASKARGRRPASLIKDLQVDKFYDVRAQVVNIYYFQMGGQVDLKVTDYTPNEQMYHYVDPEQEKDHFITDRDWKGPFGFLTLNVTLYEENANWARENIGNGDHVFIRNMRVKMSARGLLEGVLHQDRQNPSKVDIRHLTNRADLDEIGKRREEYEQKRGHRTAFQSLQNESTNTSGKTSKEKRQAKRDRQRAQKQAEQDELEKKQRDWERKRDGINTHVIAAHPAIKLSTISEIIHNRYREVQTLQKQNRYTLPFINCKHRSRVRVVDVYPPELKLFAHSNSDTSWKMSSKRKRAADDPTREVWEWGFVLLLEDAGLSRDAKPEQLRVVVNDDAAKFLLGMSAKDIIKKSNALVQLEEKLFILWGNLMELKTELRNRGTDLPLPPGDNRLQNTPFDACIEEYGVDVPVSEDNPFGFQRMFKLFQTKIQD
ncbi:hypothetical protein ACET3X_004499 [Alternaria dauci]|uniref:Protection of telomeres protein 1 n=1 Tax=Alternaria dauci TaxID=48095 RepID=A0ABR3UPB9_9PLEO